MSRMSTAETATPSATPPAKPSTFVAGWHDEGKVSRMAYRLLGNTGMDVSALSFGTSSLMGVHEKTSQQQANDIVRTAIRSGINFIDTAPWYGHGLAEQMLGSALQSVPRQAYFLATKVGRYDAEVSAMFDFRADTVISRFEDSLARLGVTRVDLVQVHDPEFCPSIDVIVNETLPALEKLRQQGKTRFIGITGYPLDVQREILERSKVRIDTSIVYCHYGLIDRSLVNGGFFNFLTARSVGVINAAPLFMGLLTDRGPPEWHPCKQTTKDACAAAAAYCRERGVNLSKLGLKYSLADERIPTTLCSCDSLPLLQLNLDNVSTPLTADEQRVSDELVARFFPEDHQWHSEEVTKYWSKLGRALTMRAMYSKHIAKGSSTITHSP